MPKIVNEEDNFSSFIWKDLPKEALAFIYQEYFTQEMSLEEYLNIYFGNKITGIKHEADRLFEEAKQVCLAEGEFPEELQDIQTTIIVKQSPAKKTSNVSIANLKPRDTSEVQRAQYNRKIEQKENDIDDLRRINQATQASNEQLESELNLYFKNSEELLYQTSRFDLKQAQREQELFREVQHTLRSKINLQNESLELTSKKTQRQQEDTLEKLYQERSKLAW
ncbi:hypothetical protein FACS1894193_12640 [Bacilli bacterium]|nr:hypothetical protein FACS1894192_11840 [Bacilli bacterium]GHU44349.1 hypothetical protein FACS1894193_12640 [Bacilli bacterium]